MLDWWYFQGVAVFLLNVACVIHVLRTGRPWWWILVFFFAPWLGMLIYFALEVLPEWQTGKAGGNRRVPFGSATGTGAESVRRLRSLVAATPTVENRVRLAAALLRNGKAGEALQIYEACLEGVYADDKTLWYEIAEAYHVNHQDGRALEYLEKLEAEGFRDYRDRRVLLTALSLEKLGRTDAALKRLERLVATFPGQEANYHYARLLYASGDPEKGRRVVEGMLERRKGHDARYRRREGRWYRAAQDLLKG